MDFEFRGAPADVGNMWHAMGGDGWLTVGRDPTAKFRDTNYKPLMAVRDSTDFTSTLERAEKYASGFTVEYEKTLRYVLSELLYNTLEHGRALHAGRPIPSLAQFTWYKRRNELSFIVADIGIGIRRHLQQAYPSFESDEEAIRYSLRPNVSGTFGRQDTYRAKNNAGVGLFLSSNIIRRLHAEMYVVSGDGRVHISPKDITSRTLRVKWPGTLVLVTIALGTTDLSLQKMMADFRAAAELELQGAVAREEDARLLIHIENFFGRYAEDKEAAIRQRDSKIMPAIEAGKTILVDFEGVVSAPHSFLSALLAPAFQRYGMQSYKKIKFVNVAPEIRETIDFIMDENTEEAPKKPKPS